MHIKSTELVLDRLKLYMAIRVINSVKEYFHYKLKKKKAKKKKEKKKENKKKNSKLLLVFFSSCNLKFA
jgi:predicted nucleotidyltransferase